MRRMIARTVRASSCRSAPAMPRQMASARHGRSPIACSITSYNTFSSSSSPSAWRFAPPPRPTDRIVPRSSASRHTVLLPPASMPSTCIGSQSYATLMPGMPSAASIAAASDLLVRAVADRIFPAAAAEVGDAAGVLWRQAFGRLTFEADTPATSERTVFDLASLAKPIATTSIVMGLAAAHSLQLHDRIAAFFPDWRGEDRESVTIEDLLEHASGLAARLVDVAPATRREFEHDICTMRLEYPPRSRAIYSDLGFLLLGFLAADLGRRSLADQFAEIAARVTDDVFGFAVPQDRHATTAPTMPLDEDVRRGRALIAEVHDNYAAALGGVAGHAGLFGTVNSVGSFARM